MLIPVILTFIAVLLIIVSASLAVTSFKESPAFALKMRLRRMAAGKETGAALPDDVRKEILKTTPRIELLLTRMDLFRKLDKLLGQAGLNLQLNIFLIYATTAAAFPAIAIFLYYRRGVVALAFFAAVYWLILLTLQLKKRKREEKLTAQLPDLLMMISRSLRAGHTVNSAIELIGMEMGNPAGELFRTAFEQQKLGMRITDALASMTNQIDSLDLRFFITTVTISAETGGNLAEVLDKLAATIRERGKVRRQVKVYTAQGRLSGYILAVLPVFVFIMINLLNPDYGRILMKEKLGHYLLLFAFIMQVFGYLVIRRIINIRI